MKRFALLFALSILLLGAACTAVPQPTIVPTEPPSIPTTAPTEQPAATQPPVGSLPDDAFDAALAQAFADRDTAALRTFMKDRFSFALDASELREVTTEEALQFMSEHQLADGAHPAAQFESDVPSLLKGSDPLGLWGPVARVVRVLHVTSLGASGMDEAVLAIGRDDSGQLYWHGIIIPNSGSFKGYGMPVEESYDTGVKYVRTLAEVNLRTGPGNESESLGTVPAGETAQVVGISADGQWYRIQCIRYLTGFCWVSADPTLTEPVDG